MESLDIKDIFLVLFGASVTFLSGWVAFLMRTDKVKLDALSTEINNKISENDFNSLKERVIKLESVHINRQDVVDIVEKEINPLYELQRNLEVKIDKQDEAISKIADSVSKISESIAVMANEIKNIKEELTDLTHKTE